MRIDAGQHMRMDQRMKLAPRMIQSMEILQLPSVALEERIEQELSDNPTLELREPCFDAEELQEELTQAQRDDREGQRELRVGEDTPTERAADDFERLTNLSEEYGESWEANTYETGPSYRPASDHGERDKKLDAMANTAARPLSLADQLLEQWGVVECDDEIRRAGEYLIGFIDDDGYIRAPMSDLISQAPRGVVVARLEEAILLLQKSLEPVGLAARDVRECLLLQIDTLMANEDEPVDLTIERLLVSDYLKDIETNRLPRIAKAANLTVEQINQAKDNLRRFHFHPGRLLICDSAKTITPDAIVEYDEQEDRYIATLCNGRTPNLQISTRYMKMAGDKGVDRKTREFVSQNIRSARWLMEAIQQRNHTLMRVIAVVLEAQRDFFDVGPQALKPLPMTQVADQLGVHVATVSRAVSEKYLQTPRGIYPLRMFFSGGTETEAGDAMSWAAVQARLEEIIRDEDKADPLNDDELVEELKKRGIDIARRTVAKYRSTLNIAPARQRRQF
ncbi:MAG: RNA polymerase factor sigma-54 [Phycisphaeraceae bacterium]|nr:RNA polymerase factor sigma-54 [Phycisphaeraceae bacterium]